MSDRPYIDHDIEAHEAAIRRIIAHLQAIPETRESILASLQVYRAAVVKLTLEGKLAQDHGEQLLIMLERVVDETASP